MTRTGEPGVLQIRQAGATLSHLSFGLHCLFDVLHDELVSFRQNAKPAAKNPARYSRPGIDAALDNTYS